ncbi:MAG TPA: adenylate/guanylate cyclase domain-containing protein [Candidatus Omnitrophota bacterium]|nr:adenylate/guanylate cyclase domain-containing protein [Candidatus Omnitrophota bacterium]
MRKIYSYLIPALILFGVFGLQYAYPEELESLRIKVFDVFQKIKPRAYDAQTPVRIIDIDEESLSRYGQWPWPRTLLAKLVSRMSASNAKAIAFDLFFPEPDRTSPQNAMALWSEDPFLAPIRSQIQKIRDHDTVFSEAIAKAPLVTAFALNLQKNSSVPLLKKGFAQRGGLVGDSAIHYLTPTYAGAVVNLPVLEKAASGNGNINMDMEHDGILRRVPMLYRLDDLLYPSLSAEAIRVVEKATVYQITLVSATKLMRGIKKGIQKIRIGQWEIPTDSHGRIWLYDTGHKSERFIPAWKVLSDDSVLKELNEKILFVGTSALGLKDLRSTALIPFAPGVEVHAQLVEQILQQDFLKRPYWAEFAELAYFFILGLFLILFLPRGGAVRCAIIGITAIACAIGLSWYAFDKWHLLTDPVFPSLVVLLIYIVSSFLNFLQTEKERSQIRGAFSRYLSPTLVEKLAKDPTQLKLGGEMKTMTFLFTDIRNFTTLAEEFNAQELTLFMNRFMTPMTNIILKHNGTIDKYIGDCIMAFWNAPLEDKNHALHACQTALEMQQFIEVWNKTREKEAFAQKKAFRPIQIGIGINTGQACVGNMGSEQRFDYTVLGDDVNLASRLEGLSKNYGLTTILGQNTVSLASFATLEVDLIRVKGKSKPVRIFALLGEQGLREKASLRELTQHHDAMLKAYRERRWEDAERSLGACRDIHLPEIDLQMIYNLYASRLFSYKKNPPAQDWDGVTLADSK